MRRSSVRPRPLAPPCTPAKPRKPHINQCYQGFRASRWLYRASHAFSRFRVFVRIQNGYIPLLKTRVFRGTGLCRMPWRMPTGSQTRPPGRPGWATFGAVSAGSSGGGGGIIFLLSGGWPEPCHRSSPVRHSRPRIIDLNARKAGGHGRTLVGRLAHDRGRGRRRARRMSRESCKIEAGRKGSALRGIVISKRRICPARYGTSG